MERQVRTIYFWDNIYKPGKLNGEVDALSHKNYEINANFIKHSETMVITKKNVKEVHGELLKSPDEFYIVSEI